MAEVVSAARAKAELSALMARVAYAGEHFIIERRGKPYAALVSIEDLERLEGAGRSKTRPHGALALVGVLGEVEDAVIEKIVEDIYAARERDRGRPVDLGD